MVAFPEEAQTFVGLSPMVGHLQLTAGNFSGFGVTNLFSVPAGTMVWSIVANVSEAFTASTTMTIGDGDEPDGYADNNEIAPTATGWKGSLGDAQPYSSGKYYSAADTVDLTLAGATPSAGTIDIWLLASIMVDTI